MSRFRPIDRDTAFLLPPSVQEWLPEGHLARYVVEVVEGLDLSELERAYAGKGSAAYHPAMLLSLLIYGYATGTFSSRKIERATYDSLAFRYIACNLHPDHDTLASFRQRFGAHFESAFVQVLEVARENQLSRFGTVSLDGTKIHANASRHSALSYGHAAPRLQVNWLRGRTPHCGTLSLTVIPLTMRFPRARKPALPCVATGRRCLH